METYFNKNGFLKTSSIYTHVGYSSILFCYNDISSQYTFSNLSILIFEAFKVWIRYSVIFPDLNDLLQSYKDIHKPHLYNIKKSPKTRCFRGNLLFFDIRLNYLFENCGARRAALRPYFLRSFIRGSRVKNPAFLRTGL